MHAGHPLYNLQLKLRTPILMAGDASRHSACLQCTQKCYRTHGNGNFNGSCFFKVMLNDFATRLRVPPKFVDQMNDLIGPDVILEGPSGQLWHAELCCMDSEVSIADGWERFVSDHAIEIGDFLVFKHAGKSHFIVQIFGRSGCEKQSHFKVTSFEKSCLQTENLCVISDLKMQENEMTHTPNFHQNDRMVDIRDKMIENVIEISDTNSCDVSVGYGKPVEKRHSSFRARKGKLDAAPSLETAKIDVPWPGSMKILQTGTADKRVKAWNCAQLSCNKKVQYIKSQRRGHKCCVSRRSMKRAGNQRVLKEALSFKTTKPICLITMSKSAVSNQCRLNFPIEFSRRWLPKDETEITLSGPDKKVWTIKYPGWNLRHTLSGWKYLVFTYDLKQGDICVFELLNKKIFMFKVHIFWAKDCIPKTRVIKVNKNK